MTDNFLQSFDNMQAGPLRSIQRSSMWTANEHLNPLCTGSAPSLLLPRSSHSSTISTFAKITAGASTLPSRIAYPADRERIFSTSVNTMDVRPWDKPQLQQSVQISFGSVEFCETPRRVEFDRHRSVQLDTWSALFQVGVDVSRADRFRPQAVGQVCYRNVAGVRNITVILFKLV